jgi:hypothetical protein
VDFEEHLEKNKLKEHFDKQMVDYSKMRCYDMRMYLFEWVKNNPEEGRYIKYIHNMSKSQLSKVCLYTEEKISKSELIEIITIAKNIMKENKKRMKDKKERNCNNTDDNNSADSYNSDVKINHLNLNLYYLLKIMDLKQCIIVQMKILMMSK